MRRSIFKMPDQENFNFLDPFSPFHAAPATHGLSQLGVAGPAARNRPAPTCRGRPWPNAGSRPRLSRTEPVSARQPLAPAMPALALLVALALGSAVAAEEPELLRLRQRVKELEALVSSGAGHCAAQTPLTSSAGPGHQQPSVEADGAVKAMYEAHPSPPRSPEIDAISMVTARPLDLPTLSAQFFGGRLLARHAPPHAPLRVLVAGCGTGDAIVALVRQLDLWAPGSQVVAVERSSASLAIARQRVEGLRNTGYDIAGVNVTLIHGSLLDLSSLSVGQFDVVECSGVLHHLQDPVAGLVR